MKRSVTATAAVAALLNVTGVLPAAAAPTTFFSTGSPDGLIATATRPGAGAFEIESADDFILAAPTTVTSGTFTGLVPTGSSPTNVVVEIYRVFPLDSNVGRTSGAPTFSTSQVPTRVNSPSDVALEFTRQLRFRIELHHEYLGGILHGQQQRPARRHSPGTGSNDGGERPGHRSGSRIRRVVHIAFLAGAWPLFLCAPGRPRYRELSLAVRTKAHHRRYRPV